MSGLDIGWNAVDPARVRWKKGGSPKASRASNVLRTSSEAPSWLGGAKATPPLRLGQGRGGRRRLQGPPVTFQTSYQQQQPQKQPRQQQRSPPNRLPAIAPSSNVNNQHYRPALAGSRKPVASNDPLAYTSALSTPEGLQAFALSLENLEAATAKLHTSLVETRTEFSAVAEKVVVASGQLNSVEFFQQTDAELARLDALRTPELQRALELGPTQPPYALAEQRRQQRRAQAQQPVAPPKQPTPTPTPPPQVPQPQQEVLPQQPPPRQQQQRQPQRQPQPRPPVHAAGLQKKRQDSLSSALNWGQAEAAQQYRKAQQAPRPPVEASSPPRLGQGQAAGFRKKREDPVSQALGYQASGNTRWQRQPQPSYAAQQLPASHAHAAGRRRAEQPRLADALRGGQWDTAAHQQPQQQQQQQQQSALPPTAEHAAGRRYSRPDDNPVGGALHWNGQLPGSAVHRAEVVTRKQQPGTLPVLPESESEPGSERGSASEAAEPQAQAAPAAESLGDSIAAQQQHFRAFAERPSRQPTPQDPDADAVAALPGSLGLEVAALDRRLAELDGQIETLQQKELSAVQAQVTELRESNKANEDAAKANEENNAQEVQPAQPQPKPDIYDQFRALDHQLAALGIHRPESKEEDHKKT